MSTISNNVRLCDNEFETTSPSPLAAEIKKAYSREEEFACALESYMADYKRHLAEMANSGDHTRIPNVRFFLRFVRLLVGQSAVVRNRMFS